MTRLTSTLFILALLFAGACQSAKQDGEDRDSVVTQADTAKLTEDVTPEEQGETVALDVPVHLEYRFRKGDTFGYLITTDQNVVLERDTLKDSNEQKIMYWYHFEVLESMSGGTARLRATCDRVTFALTERTNGREREMTYDSKEKNKPEVQKLYAQYNAPVNTPFELVVAADGRIENVENLGEVIKNFLGDDYATTKSEYRKTIEHEYALTGLKQVLQVIFQKLPDAPVGVDSTWTIVRPEKLGYLEYRNDAVYRVRDIVSAPTGRLAHIDARLTSMYTGSKKMDTGQGMATMDSFDVAGKGLTVFNMDTGHIRRRSLHTDVHVRMYVEPPEELKKMAPEQAKNFWWTQKASIDNSIEPYTP